MLKVTVIVMATIPFAKKDYKGPSMLLLLSFRSNLLVVKCVKSASGTVLHCICLQEFLSSSLQFVSVDFFFIHTVKKQIFGKKEV